MTDCLIDILYHNSYMSTEDGICLKEQMGKERDCNLYNPHQDLPE